MAHKIEAEFVMDFAEDEPKRLVRLTLDATTAREMQEAFRDGGDHNMSVVDPARAMQAYGFATFMGRLADELGARSLFSQEEFKSFDPIQGEVVGDDHQD